MVACQDPAHFQLGDVLHGLRGSSDRKEFPNLGDALYDLMWRRIVNLEFPPGSRLPDDALAKELGVSRTPMREALYRLSEVGLVHIQARRGFFVPTIFREDVIEVYDFRTAVETLATRMATPLLLTSDIAPHLDRQHHVFKHARSDDPASAEDFVHSDLLLHDLLIQRTDNRRMQQALTDLRGQLSVVHLWMAQKPDWVFSAVEEHGLILDALIAQEAESAAQAMEMHLQGVKERVLADMDLPRRKNASSLTNLAPR